MVFFPETGITTVSDTIWDDTTWIWWRSRSSKFHHLWGHHLWGRLRRKL